MDDDELIRATKFSLYVSNAIKHNGEKMKETVDKCTNKEKNKKFTMIKVPKVKESDNNSKKTSDIDHDER